MKFKLATNEDFEIIIELMKGVCQPAWQHHHINMVACSDPFPFDWIKPLIGKHDRIFQIQSRS